MISNNAKSEAIVIISAQHQGWRRGFRTEVRSDNKVYQLLQAKLREAGVVCLSNRYGFLSWTFDDDKIEESFIESFKWFIIYE